MADDKPKRIIIQYNEDDVQNVADILGYNPLTEKRMAQVLNNICFNDSVFEMIDESIREAINYVMEEMPAKENAENG